MPAWSSKQIIDRDCGTGMADDKNPAKCNRNILHIASFGREGQPGQAMPANDHNWLFWAIIADWQGS
jgi:hypothetical protein